MCLAWSDAHATIGVMVGGYLNSAQMALPRTSDPQTTLFQLHTRDSC
jgi:hypothetical protein